MPTHSIELPRPLHAKAKALAADRGITLERLLSEIVEDQSKRKVTATAAEPADRVRVRVGVTDATWDAASTRARADRTTLTAIVLGEIDGA